MTAAALTHSPADIVRWLLIALGQGTDPSPWSTGSGNDWPVFAGGEPGMPDNCVTVYDVTDQADGRTMTDGEQLVHSGVQVRIRAKDFATAQTKARALRVALDQVAYQNVVVFGAISYMVVAVCKTRLLNIGKDTASKRSLVTVNGVAAIYVI